jgi:hypothetical protein
MHHFFCLILSSVSMHSLLRKMLLLAFVASAVSARASGEFRAVGTRFMVPGLGGVSTIGIFNPVSNQAGMAFQEDAAVSLYYANTSIAAGVNNFQAMGMMPMKKGGALGISLSYFGYNLFNDKKVGLSYALKLADFVSIGAQLDIINTSIAGYGSRTSATFQLGTLFKVTDNINLGAHVYNPLRIKLNSETGERIPTVFRVGATYHRNDKFWITAELEQDLDFPLAFRAGIDYKVNDFLFLRAGVLSLPLAGTAGAGLVFGGFRMEITGAWQPVTGFSPHIGMSYVF